MSLKKIKGIGDAKFEKYGEALLEIVNDYVKEKNITIEHLEEENKVSNNIEKVRSSKTEVNSEKVKSHIVTYDMFSKGKTLEEIAKERKVSLLTIQEHIFQCYLCGLNIDLDIFIPKEYEKTILDVIKTIGAEKLKPIKEALPECIDYMAIKAVLCKYNDRKVAN